jgi:hypothetical protein
MLKRRQIAALVAAFATPWLAAGSCTPTQVASDVQLISSGLGPLVSDLVAAGVKIPADVQTQITNELAILQSQSASVTSVLSTSFSAQTVIQAVSAIAALATPFFPMAPLVAAAVQAAVLLAQGLVANGQTASATLGGMSPQQARMILQASAGK